MPEKILAIDTALFLLVNRLPHPDFVVFLSRLASGAESLGLIWFAAAAVLIVKERHQKRIILELLITLIGAASAHFIIKDIAGRLRPEIVLNNINVYSKVNSYLSFPSGHATTAFAGATILSRIFPKGSLYFFVLASLIAASRVYLGVHYPLDVLMGAVIGLMVGFIAIKLTKPAKKIKSIISILILLSFLVFTQKTFAKTVLYVEPDSLSIYNQSNNAVYNWQVLGAANLNFGQKVLRIERSKEKLSVDIAGESGEVLGGQTLDEVVIKNKEGDSLAVLNSNGKILLQEKLTQAATDLPILIKQTTGQLLATTSFGNKVINYKPQAVVEKLRKEKIILQGEIPVKLELKEDGAKLVYEATRKENKKIFGIIPITANIKTTVSAESGKIDKKISFWFYKILQKTAF